MPVHRRLIASILVLIAACLAAPHILLAAPLNDTGIVRCGDDASNDLDCPVAGYPGQDAEYGRDVTHNDDSDGHAGFSFTKLDASGQDLPANATEWTCVRDNVTGLIWEVKTDDGGLRDRDWTYTWYNPDATSNGGDPGTQDGGVCEGSVCDTQGFVEAVNALGLCGATDWRLPEFEELRSIVSYDRYNPSIDTDYFPNTPSSGFWSASPHAGNSDNAWGLSFSHGSDYGTNSKGYVGARVRLVRGGQSTPLGSYQAVGDQVCNEAIPVTAPGGRYVIHGDGTVTDGLTGLMWKRCTEGLSGTDCSTGAAEAHTWQQALGLAPLSIFAGYTDWRLPNLKELSSLIERSCYDPAINSNTFPNTASSWFWSASPDDNNSSNAWYLYFYYGDDGDDDKGYVGHVRLVRDAQPFDLLSLSVSINGSGTVTSGDGQITCPGDCSATYTETTPVTLIATPDPGWQFTGWGGACTGTADCTLTVDGPLSVTANFTQTTNPYLLDSPVNASFESGIGIAYGWVCDASQVALQIDAGTPIQAAYGAERPDSLDTCGDTNNGFAAVINWNNHGDGDHSLKLLADGQELTQAQVTVTTFGQEYLRDASATTTTVTDFPAAGLSTPLVWSESHQNFVVTSPTAASFAVAKAVTSQNNWESPQAGSFESGRSLIRGWVCEATNINATLDGQSLTVPYGSAREDTQGICGDSNNGYALAINWNDQGDGSHEIALSIDGNPLETRSFQIATPGGQGTVTGVQSRHDLSDFPNPGDSLILQWSEPHQNYRLVSYTPASTEPTNPSNRTEYLGNGDDQRELTGSTDTATRYLDFGGQDIYTLSPELAGPIKLIDNQATTVILPAGLTIDAVAFMSDGLRFSINSHPVTLLGAVNDFSFAFGDTGVTRDYAATATAFGASIPAAGAGPVSGSITGTIGSDGNIVP